MLLTDVIMVGGVTGMLFIEVIMVGGVTGMLCEVIMVCGFMEMLFTWVIKVAGGAGMQFSEIIMGGGVTAGTLLLSEVKITVGITGMLVIIMVVSVGLPGGPVIMVVGVATILQCHVNMSLGSDILLSRV